MSSVQSSGFFTGFASIGRWNIAFMHAVMGHWGKIAVGCVFPQELRLLAVLNSLVLSLMDVHHVSNGSRQIRRLRIPSRGGFGLGQCLLPSPMRERGVS